MGRIIIINLRFITNRTILAVVVGAVEARPLLVDAFVARSLPRGAAVVGNALLLAGRELVALLTLLALQQTPRRFHSRAARHSSFITQTKSRVGEREERKQREEDNLCGHHSCGYICA